MTPTISFCIPTLNSEKVISSCLQSITKQQYPSSKINIIIADGGSTDQTLKIVSTIGRSTSGGKKHNIKIVKNPLKTAEAGKAVAIKKATGKYVCLLDSDNILPHPSWLNKMVYPLQSNPRLIGSEPWAFTYRKQAGFIERYSALIGANDPYAFVTGVYDKKNHLNNRWTGLNVKQVDKGKYVQVILQPHKILPTIGANGTIFKTDFLQKNIKSDYLFDIDIIQQVLNKTRKPLYFAKVKTSIIHTFCESSISKFIKKQNRRLTDLYFYKPLRQYDWGQVNRSGIIKFSLYTLTLIPVLFDTLKGFCHLPDPAWFFHPLACLISFFINAKITIQYYLGLLKPLNRQQWQQ